MHQFPHTGVLWASLLVVLRWEISFFFDMNAGVSAGVSVVLVCKSDATRPPQSQHDNNWNDYDVT